MLSIEAEGAPRLTDNNLQDLHNFLHHAYELVEFNDYFRFVQNISKFLNLTSPWPKTIYPFFCKVSECEHVEGFPCRYCSRILKMIPKMDRCHSDMCIPVHITLVICVSLTPQPSKQAFYFCCFCEGDYKCFQIMSNIIDKRATIRDKIIAKLFLASLLLRPPS